MPTIMPSEGNFLIDLIKQAGISSANILGVLILIYYIVEKICSAFGSPELRLIKSQFTALNEHLVTLITKVR